MRLIIGLGNPGDKYEKTRHNAGFMMIDRIKKNYNFPAFEFNKKFEAQISKGAIDSKEVLLVKPETFMNNSGETVHAILDFYKLTPEDIIVIHDDIDLPLEEYKIATSSGSAGHNGVSDIIEKIGTKDFTRIRIGVANENLRSPIDPADFVLQNFSEEEMKVILDKVSGNILFEIGKLI
jgi:PTH1 family peptidyl-tRNA hydrolase